MNIFPLTLFPPGSLSSSVIPTIWVGMFVVCFFNLRLGWVLSGLVVPGYLVPLLLIKPWAASVILFEGIVTYLIVWFLSERLSSRAPWANLFGRDRFFALILCSIVVRLLFDGYLLPKWGLWVNQTWHINFDYRNQLHSFGLIIIALIANQFWKTGLIKGLIPFSVTLLLTTLIVRYGLMEWTNFNLSSISYLYEGVAASIVASPKAYIILICTAFLASRMNLLYGWDFNGILIPSLLALQWYEPVKIMATMVEAIFILWIATLLLKAPLLNKMTVEGARKLLLFFNVSFFYKIVLAYILLTWFPAIKITDFYGFGYLLSTLIAIKIHDKGIFLRLFGVTLSTSLVAVMIASLLGFLLTLLPLSSLLKEAHVQTTSPATISSLHLKKNLQYILKQAQLSFYQSKLNNDFVNPTSQELAYFSEALKILKTYKIQSDQKKLEQAKQYLTLLNYQLNIIEERYLYVHEQGKNRGWGVYVLDTQTQSGLGLEVPAPLDEEGAFNAGIHLFNLLNARSLAIAGSYRKARADLATDMLQNRQSFFHHFHQIINPHNSLQIRTYTIKTAQLVTGKHIEKEEMNSIDLKTTLWINSKIPADLDLPILKKNLNSWQLKWHKAPFKNIQRESSRYGFAELMLTKKDVRKLLFSTLLTKQEKIKSEQTLSIEGHLADWILTHKESMATRGSEAYQIPTQGELLFIDENVLTPLMKLIKTYQISGQQWTVPLLNELQLINNAAHVMGYQVIRYYDKSTRQRFLILTEHPPSSRFWGLYTFRLGHHNNYALQVSRPLYDSNSFEYATALFERLQAKALFVVTTHPDANTDGSSNLNHPNNKVNLFNLVNQVLLRSLPEQRLLVVNSRAFAYKADQSWIDADILVTFNQGYIENQELNILEKQLLKTLKMDGLNVRLVDGSEMTLGYELGSLSQAAYLAATKNKSFALLWISPEIRAYYRQQNENRWQQAQFDTLGIQSINHDLLSYVQQQRMGSIKAPSNLQTLVHNYTNSQNILHLQAIVQYAHQQTYSLTRLIDLNSRQSFLLIYDSQKKLIAMANLVPISQKIAYIKPHRLLIQLTNFVNQRDFWLQLGSP